MNKGVLGILVRFSGSSCGHKYSTLALGNPQINGVRVIWGPPSFVYATHGKSHYSTSRKEVSTVVSLDSEGSGKFVYDNFGRLRVFLKFLALQSVPLAIFAYYYRRFEGERQALYSTPLETVDEALRHLWSITRGSLCFLVVDGAAHMVNYSIGNKIDFEGVDSVESFMGRLQPNKRDLLKNIYVSYPSDIPLDKALQSSKEAYVLFYNQSLDSFAYVRTTAVGVSDPTLKKKFWTPKLGEESNNLVALTAKGVRIGFGGSSRMITLENKEDWTVVQ
ncbi:hypothetical protein BgAZ_101030 [Babesia gibsoni]|uniref:Uncharacterized protein n=1 Tax=Babesia gibsoni TaxID=33632 RepID=A0AAD8PF81_BABGI|nr:hypothetical protein BgAZ_101030 [Babesia gibsoni]